MPTTTGQHAAITPAILAAAATTPSVPFVPTQRAPQGTELPHRASRQPDADATTRTRDSDGLRWPVDAVRELAADAVTSSVRVVPAPSGWGSADPVSVHTGPQRVPTFPASGVSTFSMPTPVVPRPVAPTSVVPTPVVPTRVVSRPVATPVPVVPRVADAPAVDAPAPDAVSAPTPVTYPSRRSMRPARSRSRRAAQYVAPTVAVAGAFAAGYCGHLLLG
ncbi:hypothetical protein ACTHAM_001403 [Cellulomonas soli]|uniref:hypothetical protein n=1 Tax=Cellulomonas soli TaxID=931535 RepID=UPI003F85EB4F